LEKFITQLKKALLLQMKFFGMQIFINFNAE